jgi:hypothetical protein
MAASADFEGQAAFLPVILNRVSVMNGMKNLAVERNVATQGQLVVPVG